MDTVQTERSKDSVRGFAGEAARDGDTTAGSQIVCFRLSEEEFGVDIMRAQEIIKLGPITRIPETPASIRGLINLRGRILPVLDLRVRFGLPAKADDDQTRIIVVNVGGDTVGLVVDAVTSVLRVDAGQVAAPPTSLDTVDLEYIQGILRAQDRMIMLLRIERVLAAATLGALAAKVDA